MKKFIALVLLIALPFAVFSKKNLCDYAGEFDGATVTIYADDFKQGGINNCGLMFNSTDTEGAKELYRSAENVKGITISFSGSIKSVDDYLSLLNAKEVYREKIDYKNIIYAYSPRIQTFVKVNNKKVNLQICVDNTVVKIGSPLLLGSY